MPPWRVNLSDDDRWAVVEYIKTFSPRFANTNEDRKTVVNLGTPPARNEVNVGRRQSPVHKVRLHQLSWRQRATVMVCPRSACWTTARRRIKPRDFSKPGAFKGGYATKEIVRTVLTGFNGTPNGWV